MAEQLADLNKSKHIQTFEFNVSGVSVSDTWGGVKTSADQQYDLGVSLTNKKILVTYVPSDPMSAWPILRSPSGTRLNVLYVRGDAGTINGKLYVMVSD